MNKQMVSPRVLKGFRDMPPQQQIIRERCIQALQGVFQNFGFVPIDTPVLEHQDVLLGHAHGTEPAHASETEKQVYTFEDKGRRAVAMRFDLTVPFARYAAINQFDLPKPFNRYQIGKVFRGENAQRGRYREFIQCDFDIIGLTNQYADSTIALVIDRALTTLHPIITGTPADQGTYAIHISHRGVLSSILEREQCAAHTIPVLRIMDKTRKVPQEQTVRDLCAYMSEKSAHSLMALCSAEETNEQTLAKLAPLLEDTQAYQELASIEQITRGAEPTAQLIIDPSIMRGLDYYTGFVCETFMRKNPSIGSVCSGGRYDNLTQRFSKTPLAGVGASIGLDRLLAALEEEQEHAATPTTSCALLYGQTRPCLESAFAQLKAFHHADIAAQVYPSTQGLKHAFKYAQKIGAQFLIIIGEEEHASGTLTVKNLHTREQHAKQPLQEVLQCIQQQKTTP